MKTRMAAESDLFDLTHFGWVLDAEGYWYKPVEEKEIGSDEPS